MDRYQKLSREQLEKITDLLLNTFLHFTGAQYTEKMLREAGIGDQELADIGFDIDGEWDDMDSCIEI